VISNCPKPSRRISISDGGGGVAWGDGFCVEDALLIIIEMFVGNVVAKVTKNPNFHKVGSCASPVLAG
jgi:hypothetical protein